MTLEEIMDPKFITDLATIIIFIAAVAYGIKQRAKIIINSTRMEKKDEEIAEKDAMIMEQTGELEVVGQGLNTMNDNLNLIVQASKMTPQDKAAIMERATANKQKVNEYISQKEQRIKKILEKTKSIKEDPSQILSILSETGESILEKYTQETDKQ